MFSISFCEFVDYSNVYFLNLEFSTLSAVRSDYMRFKSFLIDSTSFSKMLVLYFLANLLDSRSFSIWVNWRWFWSAYLITSSLSCTMSREACSCWWHSRKTAHIIQRSISSIQATFLTIFLFRDQLVCFWLLVSFSSPSS